MMKSNIPCEMIRDLLPSYIDGLSSDVTNREIEGHVRECDACREVLDAMRDPKAEPEDSENRQEIDFLKKTRKGVRNAALASVMAALLLIVAVLGSFVFLVGRETNSDFLVYDLSVDGQNLTIKGHATTDIGIKEVRLSDADGIVRIDVQSVQKSLIYLRSFETQYTAAAPIRQIWVADRIVWSQGEAISPITAAVFQSWHAYVGDMSANGATVRALGMVDVLGNFTNELQTKEEPYGWKLILQNSFSDNRKAAMEEKMQSFAYVLLASVENLGYVTFEYKIDDARFELTVHADEASVYARSDIKQIGKDVNALEDLMQKTGLDQMVNLSYTEEFW